MTTGGTVGPCERVRGFGAAERVQMLDETLEEGTGAGLSEHDGEDGRKHRESDRREHLGVVKSATVSEQMGPVYIENSSRWASHEFGQPRSKCMGFSPVL